MENAKKESRINNVEKNTARRLLSFLLALAILATLGLYLILPIRPIEKTPVPHVAFFFSAFQHDFLNWVWFGGDLPDAQPTGERALAFLIGTILFLYLTFFGRALLTPWTRLLKAQRVDKLALLFLSGTLGLATLATLSLYLGLAKRANAPVLLIITILFPLVIRRKKKADESRVINDFPKKEADRASRALCAVKVALLALFVSFYLFAATQPLWEYDAVEYHAQGAREFYESGAIQFSENNVYVNMPLGAETFYLAGFNIARDLGFSEPNVLRIGSLIGKTLLAYATLLTALGLASFCKRFVRTKTSPYWSALIYLSFPALFENVSNGLNDAPLALALFAVFFVIALEAARDREVDSSVERRRVVGYASLLGLLAGFAISIKYTAVPFILAPTLLAVAFLEFAPKRRASLCAILNQTSREELKESVNVDRKTSRCALALFLTLGVALLVGGGWYYKNYAATGNPVYPLAFDVFGDSTGLWNDSINARWTRAHSPDSYSPEAIGSAIASAFFLENYASSFFYFLPIVFFVLVGAWIARRRDATGTGSFLEDRRILSLLFVFFLIFVAVWALCTHRISRFLIPIATFPAVILGSCAARVFNARSALLRVVASLVVLTLLGYSGILIDLIGQGRLAPLPSLERDPDRYSGAAIYFNDHPEILQSDSEGAGRLLLVGEAKAFDYRVPVLYSTCWNDSPLMKALDGAVELDGELVKRITDPGKVRAMLKEMRVRYILVDFGELYRFRSEGNYGFNNPEINESLFFSLVGEGVIEQVENDDIVLFNSVKLFRVLESPDEETEKR